MTELEFNKDLRLETTPIPGLVILDLQVFGDARGWFKENYQKEKMESLGLPDIKFVQNNISFNSKRGTTRGIHAEPWDKYISVGSGCIFGAWIDLRQGENYGKTFTAEIDSTKAIFVPRGVANAFQTLEDNTVYTYLVNDHWSKDAQSEYVFLNLADSTVDIKWPIPLDQAELSEKDKNHPFFADIEPVKPKKVLVTGSNGQLGQALHVEFPDAEFTDYQELDITDPDIEKNKSWRRYDTIINAAAFTAVDKAETPEGRKTAWALNAKAVANLSKIATKYNLTLVHISSDYVFDGTVNDHTEDEEFSPLGIYAQTKTAGDIAVSEVPKHYIVRTSWVIGNGNNFVKTIQELAKNGVKPGVVNDQIGRLTFTIDLARGIKHLLDSQAPFGTYNLSCDGEPASWAEIAKKVYELSNKNPDDVTPVSTEEYYANKTDISPRPLLSTLNLDKIKSTGFQPINWRESLERYLKENES